MSIGPTASSRPVGMPDGIEDEAAHRGKPEPPLPARKLRENAHRDETRKRPARRRSPEGVSVVSRVNDPGDNAARSARRCGNGKSARRSSRAQSRRASISVALEAATSQESFAQGTPWMGRPFASKWRSGEEGSSRTFCPPAVIIEAGEPVRPGMEKRDAGRRAALGRGLEILDAAEELDAAMAKRGAEHPEARKKYRLEIAGRDARRGWILDEGRQSYSVRRRRDPR